MALVKSHNYNILIDEEWAIFKSFVESLKPSSVFVIADQNTKKHCLPVLEEMLQISFSCIQIAAGEQFKNLKTCAQIWDALIKNGCDRQSLIINLGGGVIGDMGGFVASSYMRGIAFIQVPTSLLAQVDASVGGKLGIDFLSYKNMIGLFNNPKMVWVNTGFLSTLPERELKSGFAELIKHALVSSRPLWESIYYFESEWNTLDWSPLVYESILIKEKIVAGDPHEKGKRKVLNFGHTIGHAIESLFMNTESPLLHGEAIAIGMVCEAHLSYQKGLLDKSDLKQLTGFIHRTYGLKAELTKHQMALIELMRKDKKNYREEIMFSVIPTIGDCLFNQKFEIRNILKSFEYFENSYN